MRFYTKPHRFYRGIDQHARWMYLCILNAAGEVVVHRTLRATPTQFLAVIAPYREDIGVAVEGMFTWYWIADGCARNANEGTARARR